VRSAGCSRRLLSCAQGVRFVATAKPLESPSGQASDPGRAEGPDSAPNGRPGGPPNRETEPVIRGHGREAKKEKLVAAVVDEIWRGDPCRLLPVPRTLKPALPAANVSALAQARGIVARARGADHRRLRFSGGGAGGHPRPTSKTVDDARRPMRPTAITALTDCAKTRKGGFRRSADPGPDFIRRQIEGGGSTI